MVTTPQVGIACAVETQQMGKGVAATRMAVDFRCAGCALEKE
jgi:hypothetical protein